MNKLENKSVRIIFPKIFFNLITKSIIILIKFLTSIILANFLGPIGKGTTFAFQSISGIVSNYSNLSVDDSIIYNNNKKNLKNENLFFTSIVYFFILSLIAILALSLLLFFFPKLFYDLEKYIFKIYCFIPLLIGETISHSCLKSLKKFKIFNILSIFSRLNLASILLIGLILNPKIDTAIDIYLLISAINLIISYLSLFLICKKFKKITFKFFNLFSYGSKIHFGTVLAESEHKMDIYFILYFLGTYELGIYSISLALASLIIYIPNSFNSVLFSYTSKNETRNKNFTKFSNYYLMIFLIIFIFLILIFGKKFIEFFYGDEFISAYSILLFLLPALFFDSLSRIKVNYFKSNNSAFILNSISLISLILNIILLFFLIPNYGLIGAALSSSTSYTVKYLILQYFYVLKTSEQS